jgi:hypothetical protein
MIWPYGFAVFGVVCAVAIAVGIGMFIRQISRDGWNN